MPYSFLSQAASHLFCIIHCHFSAILPITLNVSSSLLPGSTIPCRTVHSLQKLPGGISTPKIISHHHPHHPSPVYVLCNITFSNLHIYQTSVFSHSHFRKYCVPTATTSLSFFPSRLNYTSILGRYY